MAKRKLRGGIHERVWNIYYAAFYKPNFFPGLIRGQAVDSLSYATSKYFLVKKSVQHDTSG